MRTVFIILCILLLTNLALAQQAWMTRNLLNTPLEFRMHKDSIDNTYEIVNGSIHINNKEYYLADSLEGVPRNQFLYDHISHSILINKDLSSNLYAILSFAYDRLFDIQIYSNEPYYVNNFHLELKKRFKNRGSFSYQLTNDSTVRYDNRIVTYGKRYSQFHWSLRHKKVYYYLHYDIINGSGYLNMSDARVIKRIPSFCGRGSNYRTWEGLEAYLSKK